MTASNDNAATLDDIQRDLDTMKHQERAKDLLLEQALRMLAPFQVERAIDETFKQLLSADGIDNARQAVESHHYASIWIREMQSRVKAG